jgi:hypothetical protein
MSAPVLDRYDGTAGGVADSMVFKKYAQMKLQMKREALLKLNRQASELGRHFDTATAQ